MKIILAGKYPENTYDKLRAMLPEDQFSIVAVDTQEDFDLVTDAEIIVLRIFKAPKEVIERNKNLKMIMRWGAGFDSVDVEAASRQGVLVTNTPGANASAVAELAVMLMLAIGRKLLCHIDILRGGNWSKNTFLNSSFCLNGKVVGIIGAGNIGRQVAGKVQAFGASTQYYDLYRLSPEMEKEFNLKFTSLQELVATSDIITLHIPLTDDKYVLDFGEFAQMKNGAIIINTSRAGLVNEDALLQAIESGKLAGAGLDVVANEPLAADDPMLKNPNIIVTPHIGGGTADIADAIIPMLAEDIKAYAAAKEVVHVVNRELLKQHSFLK